MSIVAQPAGLDGFFSLNLNLCAWASALRQMPPKPERLKVPGVLHEKSLQYLKSYPPPPKFNSEFTPEKWWDWKTSLCYWKGYFLGASC